MTKAASPSRRSDPLDRDGHAGGSLAGNNTAPYEADADLVSRIRAAGFDLTVGQMCDWPADTRAAVQAWLSLPNYEDTAPPEVLAAAPRIGDDLTAEPQGEGDPQPEPEAAQDPEETADDPEAVAVTTGETFTEEEIAAGYVETTEGEPAPEPAPVLEAELFTVTPEDPRAAPVAVRMDQVRALAVVKRFYRLKDGTFATDPAAIGGIEAEAVELWKGLGLAEEIESAGNWGGVKITAFGRQQIEAARFPGQRDGRAA